MNAKETKQPKAFFNWGFSLTVFMFIVTVLSLILSVYEMLVIDIPGILFGVCLMLYRVAWRITVNDDGTYTYRNAFFVSKTYRLTETAVNYTTSTTEIYVGGKKVLVIPYYAENAYLLTDCLAKIPDLERKKAYYSPSFSRPKGFSLFFGILSLVVALLVVLMRVTTDMITETGMGEGGFIVLVAAFVLLAVPFFMYYMFCRVSFGEETFTVQNMFLKKRTYRYDEVTLDQVSDIKITVGYGGKKVVSLSPLFTNQFELAIRIAKAHGLDLDKLITS